MKQVRVNVNIFFDVEDDTQIEDLDMCWTDNLTGQLMDNENFVSDSIESYETIEIVEVD